jgi:hypothetical protein
MQATKMTRAEMIRKLVAYSVNAALAEGKNHYWLSELFEKGFNGYSNFSSKQLMMEMQLRGLAYQDDALEDDIDEIDQIDDIELESLSDFLVEKEEIE